MFFLKRNFDSNNPQSYKVCSGCPPENIDCRNEICSKYFMNQTRLSEDLKKKNSLKV